MWNIHIRKDLACAKSFRTADCYAIHGAIGTSTPAASPAEALVVLTYYQRGDILSDNVKKVYFGGLQHESSC